MYTKLSIATRGVSYISDTNRAEGVHSRIYHAYERVMLVQHQCAGRSRRSLVFCSVRSQFPVTPLSLRSQQSEHGVYFSLVFFEPVFSDEPCILISFSLYFRQSFTVCGLHYTRHDPHTAVPGIYEAAVGLYSSIYNTKQRETAVQYYGRA